MSRGPRIGVSQGANEGWNVFQADGALMPHFDRREAAEQFARELGWTPAPKRRIHLPWAAQISEDSHAVRAALVAWRSAEAFAEAQDPGCDPLERDQARASVRKARQHWEAAVAADEREAF
jgi:hypothetical protein